MGGPYSPALSGQSGEQVIAIHSTEKGGKPAGFLEGGLGAGFPAVRHARGSGDAHRNPINKLRFVITRKAPVDGIRENA